MSITTETTDSAVIREYRIRLPHWLRSLPSWMRVSGVLLLLCAISVYIRSRYVGGQFWMDEGITVGISSHSLAAIPGIMRVDGSPPLYYLLLHVWMSWVGNGEAATHWLSILFATLTIPISYWGTLGFADKRAALSTATVFAFNAFLDYYSLETRMYTLMLLLGLLATIGFIRGFVLRDRRYVVLFAVAQALMFYTHNWSLFFAAASVISLAILYRYSGEEIRKGLIRDAVYAYVGAVILFAPWIPNFIFQVIHTAAPWDTRPRFGAPIQIATGVIGAASLTVVMVVGACVGYSPLFMRPRKMTQQARVALMLFCLGILTLVVAWISSQVVTPAWVVRYFAPAIPAMLMLLAIGISRAGVAGAIAMIFLVLFMARPSAFEPAYKSDMQGVAGEMAPLLHKGDLVIVGQPESTPLAFYYLPGGLTWANTMGPIAHPSYVNWVNALARYRAENVPKTVDAMLNTLKMGQQLLFIRPMTEGALNWKAPWTVEIRRRSAQYGAIIAADKQLVQVATAPHYYRGACCIADSAVLYKKVH
jgi:mannosyltransferase